MKNRVLSCAVLSLTLVLLTISAWSQAEYATAQLRGTVVDPNGAVVPGATVTATNTHTGIAKSVKTESDGQYRILALRPGAYDIEIAAPGFSKLLARQVSLTVGQTLVYDGHLKVGASETVEVHADIVPLIQTEQTQQANTIEQRQIESLPNISRTFTHDVYTLPGVSNSETTRTQNPGFTGYLTTGFSIGGSNGRNNLSTIDGGENEYGTGQYRITLLPVEAIQEYQVNRNGYAAEFGFTNGSAINIVTKSGGNTWHGSAYGYFRNQDTSAANFFNSFSGTTSKPFSQNVYLGESLGGALVKNKLFVFESYEYQRVDTPFFNLILNSADAQGISQPGLGANCATQFASGTPDQVCYVNALKTSGDPFLIGFANGITPGLTPINNPALKKILTRDNGVFNNPDRFHNVITRLDYQPTEKDSFSFRAIYAHNDYTDILGGITNGTPDGNTLAVRDFSVLADWTRTINPGLVNQLLVQIVPRNRFEALPIGFHGVNFSLGTLGAEGLGGTSSFGSPALIPYREHQSRYQFEDNMTLTSGKQTFKFGASERAASYHIEDDLWFNPEFDFKDGVIPLISLAPAAVQGHLVAFNLGRGLPATGPTSTNLNAGQEFAFGVPLDEVAGFNNPKWHGWGNYFGAYLQDSWKARSNLTVNAGVRFDADAEPAPGRTDVYVSPRLGFAWDPFGDHKTVVRAGAGLYVAPVDVLIPSYGALLNGTGGYINESLTVLSPTDPRVAQLWGLGVAKGELPFGSLTPADYAAVGININTPGATVGYSVAPDYRNPYTVQTSFSVEREVMKDYAVELGYLMYHGVHLQMPIETAYQEIDPGNPICATPAVAAKFPGCVDATGGPLYAPTGTQFQHTQYSSIGNSIYHGMTVSFTKRYSHGFQFQTHYTWSKTIDDTIDFASFQNWFRPSRLNLFRAPSVFDVPHLFTANAVYTTPFKPGSGAMGTILGDITLSTIMTFRSGLPFSVRTPGLNNKINGQELDNNYAMPFFASRDNNRGAGFYTVDLGAQKAIYVIRDRGVRVLFNVQATNILNHTNFNHVNDQFDNGTPAQPINLVTGPFTGIHGVVPTDPTQLTRPGFFSSADSPRQVQFGLKIAF